MTKLGIRPRSSSAASCCGIKAICLDASYDSRVVERSHPKTKFHRALFLKGDKHIGNACGGFWQARQASGSGGQLGAACTKGGVKFKIIGCHQCVLGLCRLLRDGYVSRFGAHGFGVPAGTSAMYCTARIPARTAASLALV